MAARIEWDESFSTGVQEIDQQHRELIAHIAMLQDAVEHRKGNAEVIKMIDFLVAYADEHFRCEEECFELHKCPFAKVNTAAHELFRQDVAALRREIVERGITLNLGKQIEQKLVNWVVRHLGSIDARLRDSIKKHVA